MKPYSSQVLYGLCCSCLLSANACTGVVERPGGPAEAPSFTDGSPPTSSPGDQGATGGHGDRAGEPANLGTGVFALCEGGAELPGPRLLRLMTRREYRNTVRDLLFIPPPDVSSLPVEPRVRGFDNNSGASAVTSRHVDAYQALARDLARRAVAEQRARLVPCDPSSAGCERTFIETFGLRAFRRPLNAEEVTRYQALFADELTEGNFDNGLRLVIESLLISPSFLYRSEVGQDRGDGIYVLEPYEVASALSYLYWGTMPDEELLSAAALGELSSPAQLRVQAERLLADPHAAEQLGELSLQWLRSDSVIGANKDATLYPAFTDAVRGAMVEEQKRFFSGLVLGDGRFEDLFLAPYVLANSPLASFYGLPAPPTGDFEAIAASAESERGGLLTLGAVLAAHAHSNESSPIKRGLFVRDRLLCQDLPPPPASLDTTPPGLDPTLTTRERFARHTNDPACSGCHQFIDGVGFGFEGFDGVGQLRLVENDLPVDTGGTILGLEGLDTGKSHRFDGPRGLAALLAHSPTAQACLALQLFRFARGYEERRADACSLAKLKQDFEAGDLTLRELFLALSQLSSLVLRSEG